MRHKSLCRLNTSNIDYNDNSRSNRPQNNRILKNQTRLRMKNSPALEETAGFRGPAYCPSPLFCHSVALSGRFIM